MGSVTYLSFINSTLKRVRVVQGDAGDLVTSTVTSTATGLIVTGAFTDGARQNEIDIMLQIANETFHEVYAMELLSPECASATLTLVTTQREYSLPTDFERFAGKTAQSRVWRGATRQVCFGEYPGGYDGLLADQAGLASQWQGEPSAYAISPVVLAQIRLDREPTSAENGWTYNSLYEKRISRSSTQATDTLPFSDTVSDALVPVVAEWWQRVFKKEFDQEQFRVSIARALDFMTQTQRNTRYGPPVSWR